MVTNYITLDQAGKYAELFKAATELLDNGTTIVNLKQYYENLGNIRDKAVEAQDYKYFLLPLDEPRFVINGNTREIIVPSEFVKNGLGVEGDQFAETIYFEVDRYFDTQDLFNIPLIYIQWLVTGKDGKPIEGLSEPSIIDLTEAQDKIVFNWHIGEQISQAAGNIKFAVRFCETGTVDGKPAVVYSLSTKTATVKINSTLSYNVFDSSSYVQVSPGITDIYNRLVNSSDNGIVRINIPNFVSLNLSHSQGELGGANEVYTVDNNNVYAKLTLVPGTSSAMEFADMVCTWREVLDESDRTLDKEIGTSKHPTAAINVNDTANFENCKMIATQDERYNNNKIYYTTTDNVNYTIAPKTENPADSGYCECYCVCEIDAAGKYSATAIGQIGSNTSSIAFCPKIWEFESPEDFAIDSILSYKGDRNFERGTDTVELHINAPATNASPSTQQEAALYSTQLLYAPSVVLNSGVDETKGNWSPNEVSTFVGTSVELTHTPQAVGYNYMAEAGEEGYYQVKVTKTLNKESKSAFSNVLFITETPGVPSIDSSNLPQQAPLGTTLKIKINEPAAKYTYKVDWYFIKSGASNPVKVSTTATLDENYESSITPISNANNQGKYYAVVTAYYNDGSNTASSAESYLFYPN